MKRFVPFLSILFITIILFGGSIIEAQTVLAEWNGAESKNIPRNAGFHVDGSSGAKAALLYDNTTVSPGGSGALKIEINALASTPVSHNIQMWFMYPKGVESGRNYRISLLIKASRNICIKPRIIQDGGGYAVIGEPGETEVALSQEWKNLVFEFVANEGFKEKPVRVASLGGLGLLEPGTVIDIACWKFELTANQKSSATPAVSAKAAPFTLTSSQFVQWYQLGENVKFTLKKGGVPATMQTLTGRICDVKGRTVDTITVNNETFLASGWNWKPALPGYYEIIFEYRDTESPVPVILTESYTMTIPKTETVVNFPRDRFSIAVAPSAPRQPSQRCPRFGFSTFGEWGALRMANLIGFDFVRLFIPWGTKDMNAEKAVETAKGQYHWTELDAQIAAATDCGFDIVGTIMGTPLWASSRPEETSRHVHVPGWSSYAPKNIDDFGDFSRALATRYGRTVHTWEIWNEPHLPGYSCYWLDTPEKFVSLMKSGYQSIKAVQPDATVWYGGLVGVKSIAFYKETLRLGAGRWFDKLALHGGMVNAGRFNKLNADYGVPAKPWVNSEDHAILKGNGSGPYVATEANIAKELIYDFLYQMKHGAERISLFEMRSLVDREVIPYSEKAGVMWHCAGLFRQRPRYEPRYVAVVARTFLDQLEKDAAYQNECISGVQKSVLLRNGGGFLLVTWNDGNIPIAMAPELVAMLMPSSRMVDAEGRNVSLDTLLEPGILYFIPGVNAEKMPDRKAEVLISENDKKQRTLGLVKGHGNRGPLFQSVNGMVSDQAFWNTLNWNWVSIIDQTTVPHDFRARFAIGVTNTGFDLAVAVDDAVFFQKESNGQYWNGDSVQFAIDTMGTGFPGDQVEFVAALTPSGPVLIKNMAARLGGALPDRFTPGGQPLKYGSIAAEHRNNHILYKMHIDWTECYPFIFDAARPVRFSVLVNNNDGKGRAGYLEWAGGIGGKDKDPAMYGNVTCDK